MTQYFGASGVPAALPRVPRFRTLRITVPFSSQEYGAYVSDYSGAINLYADGSPEAQKEWDAGLLDTYELRKVFDAQMLRRLRVIKMGEFIDNKN